MLANTGVHGQTATCDDHLPGGRGMSGRLPMTAGERKLRLTLTVLDQDHELGPTLELLLDRGVAADRIGLILDEVTADAITTTAELSLRHRSSREYIAAGLTRFADSPLKAPLLASRNLIRLSQEGWLIPLVWRISRHTDTNPRLAADLEARVRTGGVVLTIEASDQAEQWRATRLLLQQSETPVIALEFSLPTAA